MARRPARTLQFSALRISQHPDHPLYLFGVEAQILASIAGLSRVARDETGQIDGYQRPEVRSHVQDIAHYLDASPRTLFPNSIILAFSKAPKFKPSGTDPRGAHVTAGTLTIPVPPPSRGRPALIVDGQQRAMALARSVNKDLPVPVAAFVASDLAVQRDQFIRINNTRPLPRGLVAELLPAVPNPLPHKLTSYRFPAAVCERLMRDEASPFHGIVQTASERLPPERRGRVAGSALLAMVRESAERPSGCLFCLKPEADAPGDVEAAYAVVRDYWLGVRQVFPEAWGLPPSSSRLMHSIGIRSMGRLMDRVMAGLGSPTDDIPGQVARQLAPLREACHWTEGRWPEVFDLPWNGLQLVPSHLRALSEFLVRTYLASASRA